MKVNISATQQSRMYLPVLLLSCLGLARAGDPVLGCGGFIKVTKL